MASVLGLAASIKENNENISRKVQLMVFTIKNREELKELNNDPDYVSAVATYDKLMDGLTKMTSHDMVGLTAHANKIREQAVVVASLVEAYFAKHNVTDVDFGLARVHMFYPLHPDTNGLV